MKNFQCLVGILALAALAVACEPEPGPGGKAEIRGVAAHHATVIPATRVFIKYDANESPGTLSSLYDDSTVAGSDGRFDFSELQRGVYYLYGIGWDSTIDQEVRAGMPVVLTEKNEIEDVILPVTE